MLLKTANVMNPFLQKVGIKRLMDDVMMMVAGVKYGGN